jgi:hypothetical protein
MARNAVTRGLDHADERRGGRLSHGLRRGALKKPAGQPARRDPPFVYCEREN